MKFTNIMLPALSLLALAITSCVNLEEKTNGGKISQNISVQEAYDLIRKHAGDSDFIILDIRTVQEYRAGHIENAVHINFHDRDFREKLDKLDRKKTYLIYCHTAGRTGIVLPIMKNMSFSSVYNMTGGIAGWNRLGLPLATE